MLGAATFLFHWWTYRRWQITADDVGIEYVKGLSKQTLKWDQVESTEIIRTPASLAGRGTELFLDSWLDAPKYVIWIIFKDRKGKGILRLSPNAVPSSKRSELMDFIKAKLGSKLADDLHMS